MQKGSGPVRFSILFRPGSDFDWDAYFGFFRITDVSILIRRISALASSHPQVAGRARDDDDDEPLPRV